VPALTGIGLALAALLALAGAQKLVDPTMTVGALRALGLPSHPVLVRLGSAAELALGIAAISVGGAVLWWLVAASYVAFAVFVVAALHAGTPIGSCGCFGREETPPHGSHVALNLVLAALAGATAVTAPGSPVDAIVDHPGAGLATAAVAALAVVLLWAAYVVVPRTIAAGAAVRRST
jgi:hypothetical protein